MTIQSTPDGFEISLPFVHYVRVGDTERFVDNGVRLLVSNKGELIVQQLHAGVMEKTDESLGP